MITHNTALHQRADERWECWSVSNSENLPLVGYCVPSIVMVQSVVGLPWDEIFTNPEHYQLATVLARCSWITKSAWERDRKLRMEHREQFHCDGHKTEKEAIACYQQFIVDFGVSEV